MLDGAAGHWEGTNGFRFMPNDPIVDRPASGLLVEAAGGHLRSFAYTWQHPDDGPQEGLLVLGPGVAAFWGDSWHQQPEPRALSGTATDDGVGVELECDYGGGWAWQIGLRVEPGVSLTMEMRNVIPEDQATADEQADPYVVMHMELHPA